MDNNSTKLTMEIFLILIAFILVGVISPFGILFNLLFNWKNRKKYFLSIAISLDQLGNTTCSTLLNMTCLRGEYVSFGDPDDTISAVLGKNKANKTLSDFGKKVTNLLNELDENHVEKASGTNLTTAETGDLDG